MKHKTSQPHYQEIAELVALKTCCESFTAEMQAKLVKQHEKGNSGWDDPQWTKADIKEALIEHIQKGDMVDVALFAMFNWNRIS